MYDPASSGPTSVTPALPPGSWDTHFHVFPADYTVVPSPPFGLPPRIPGEVEEEWHAALGIQHRVLAHSFAFGTDLASLNDYIAQSSPERLRRGIACLADDAGEDVILALHAKGVRGVRATPPGATPAERAAGIKRIAERLDRAGVRWSICIQDQDMGLFDELLPLIPTLPRTQTLIIDHMGFLRGPWSRPSPSLATEAEVVDLPGVKAVLALLTRPNVYVKLSAAYRLTSDDATLAPLVAAMARIAPDRLLWASDWPYVPLHEDLPALKAALGPGEEATLRTEDMPAWLALLRGWLGEEVFRGMMVENPARLYAE